MRDPHLISFDLSLQLLDLSIVVEVCSDVDGFVMADVK